MLDVYRAVEENKPLLHLDTHINAECGIGQGVQRVIQRKYNGIQQAAETAMQQVCLLDIITEFQADFISNGEALRPL